MEIPNTIFPLASARVTLLVWVGWGGVGVDHFRLAKAQ